MNRRSELVTLNFAHGIDNGYNGLSTHLKGSWKIGGPSITS